MAKVEGKLQGSEGKTRRSTTGKRMDQEGFEFWTGSWELFDLPPGEYSLELTAYDAGGQVVTSRREKVTHAPSSTP